MYKRIGRMVQYINLLILKSTIPSTAQKQPAHLSVSTTEYVKKMLPKELVKKFTIFQT